MKIADRWTMKSILLTVGMVVVGIEENIYVPILL